MPGNNFHFELFLAVLLAVVVLLPRTINRDPGLLAELQMLA
jgi:hypothetical protein